MQTRIHEQGKYKVEIKYFEAVFGRDELRQYAVEEAGILRSRKWRMRFGETVMPLIEQLPGIMDFEFEKPEDFLKLLPFVQKIVLESLNDVFDLLVLYSPELESNREWLENNATDRQIVDAFMGVLQLAVPFEVDKFMGNLTGSKTRKTGSNLPSASGDTSQEQTSA